MSDGWRGSADLDVLRAELAHWPSGWHVTEIRTSCVWSGGPTPGPGLSHRAALAGWCVTVEQDGCEPLDRWFHWGDSIADAAARLADHMRVRRENPHIVHVDESRYLADCEACRDDVARLPVAYRPELEPS